MASRPTKYAHVMKGLPKFNGETPERQQTLNALKDEVLSTPTAANWNVSAQILSTLADGEEIVKHAIALNKESVGADDHSAATLARAYADARVMKDAIADWASNIQLLLDAFEQMMVKQMETERVASLRLESGASVSTYSEPYGQVVDKDLFRYWCIANGYENQLQLWPSTMNAIAKERTLQGEAPPDGVEVSARTQVRLNKA